jgi:hypothetical protein
MDLMPYVAKVRDDLLVAAEAAGDEGRELAGRLVAPLESTIRLTLLNALSAAADEITRELAPGSVDLRLRGLDPTFVVTVMPAEQWHEPDGATMVPLAPSGPQAAPVADEEGSTARINFRPPEHLKARIEEAAGRESLSVNAWLVRAVNGVLGTAEKRPESRRSSSPQSFTGWVR